MNELRDQEKCGRCERGWQNSNINVHEKFLHAICTKKIKNVLYVLNYSQRAGCSTHRLTLG